LGGWRIGRIIAEQSLSQFCCKLEKARSAGKSRVMQRIGQFFCKDSSSAPMSQVLLQHPGSTSRLKQDLGLLQQLWSESDKFSAMSQLLNFPSKKVANSLSVCNAALQEATCSSSSSESVVKSHHVGQKLIQGLLNCFGLSFFFTGRRLAGGVECLLQSAEKSQVMLWWVKFRVSCEKSESSFVVNS
jgi:hypothetical protein